MKRYMTLQRITQENDAFAGTGGRSQENATLRFTPAFYDFARGVAYPSRFADGTDAPFHVLDGLPDEAVVERDYHGRVVAARHTLISGFLRAGFFYTRSAAARAAREWTAGEGGVELRD